ncbi:hypothetical protein AXF42_Ash003236 [Apostasia shenzhenica]|uniref:Uncharacterized protein n=1 Tax=Apostasia shenzhenica TaxID=1088818 RepID=A0A2I0BFN8_9ASPA|nr:hypothetical protein AXF42_Ash003236 [Apostasia shenzhenica]
MRQEIERESPAMLNASASSPQLPEDDDGRFAGSPPQISALPGVAVASEAHDGYDDDFEFQVVVRDPEMWAAVTADEIFCNGQIRPIYPVFNRDLLAGDGGGEKQLRKPLRRLMIEERESATASRSSSSSSSSVDDLEGVPPETYCVWKPKSAYNRRCRKVGSTGSSFRWRIHDLVVGRSHSDGKEKFVFVAPVDKRLPDKEPSAEGVKEKKKNMKGKGKQPSEMDLGSAHRVLYGLGATAKGEPAARKSFPTYKPVGFFANVDGLSREHHPF